MPSNYPYTPYTTPPKNNSNSIAILSCILAVLVVIAVIVCVAYVKLNSSDSKDKSEKSETTINMEDENFESTEDTSIVVKEENTFKPKTQEETVDSEFKSEHTAYGASDIVSKVELSSPTDTVIDEPYYNSIQDSKFDYKISFPRHFKQDRILNGSARSQYISADGSAYFRVSAAYNGGNITPKDISDEFARMYGGDITYNPVQETWFAISSTDGYNCLYAYFRIKGDTIKGFEFHFTDYERNISTYEHYINHIYESFKDI